MTKVSIIIPVYNGQDTIKRAIESVLNQSYKNFELLVVDNGSSDKTVDIVEKIQDSRITLLHSPKGRSKARNYGLKYAKGQFIAFLDADDEFETTHLENGMNILLGDSSIHLYTDDTIFIKNGLQLGSVTSYINKKNSDLLNANFLNTSSPIFKKTKFILFDENLEFNEDWLFWASNFHDKKMYMSSEVGGFKYITGENTMTKIEMPASMSYVYACFKSNIPNFKVNFKTVFKSILWLSTTDNLKFANKKVKKEFKLLYSLAITIGRISIVNKYLIRRHLNQKDIYN